jgi:hypothetical protein
VPDGSVTSSDICPPPGGTLKSNRRNLQHCRSALIMRAIHGNVSSFAATRASRPSFRTAGADGLNVQMIGKSAIQAL